MNELRLECPLPGTDGQEWVIENYVDLDDGPALLDYMGGTKTYDGHNGIDFDVPTFRAMDADFPVLAAAAGTVVDLDDAHFDRNTSCVGLWNFVLLRHAGGWQTIYGHFKQDSVVVTIGEVVGAGQMLGVVGSSGCSFAPHLHFALYDVTGTAVDPFLEDRWENPPVYDTPIQLMDTVLLDQDITGIDMIMDPAPNVTTMSLGETLGVGLVIAGGANGDQIELQLLNPNDAIFDIVTWNFDQTYRHTFWWYNRALSGVAGDWTIEIRINGVLVRAHVLTVQ